MVLWKKAETVARLIGEPGAELEIDMHRLLLGVLPVEALPPEEGCLARRIARGAQDQDRLAARLRRRERRLDRYRSGRPDVELGRERLDEPGRLLASGRAEVQPRLAPEENGIGVIDAIIATLAAILLSHRGHQARRQRSPLGHRDAIGRRQRRIVPGRLVVAGERGAARCGRPGGVETGQGGTGEGCGRGNGAERGGEEARQPDALLLGEGAVWGTRWVGGTIGWNVTPKPPRPCCEAGQARAAVRKPQSLPGRRGAPDRHAAASRP